MSLRKTNLFYFALLLAALVTLFTGLPYDEFKWHSKTVQGQYGEPEPPPPPPDTDGDGLIDTADACPFVFGPVENAGCPWGDADEDGYKDNVDSCPDDYAPSPFSTDGCPLPLDPLPEDGPCVLATATSVYNIRLREKADLNSETVGGLSPFDAPLQVVDISEDGEWYLVRMEDGQEGWVANWVARTGGDCENLGESESVEINPVVTAFDWDQVFAGCAHLIPDLQQLPVHVTMGLAAAEDPCAAAVELLGEMAFAPPPFNGLEGAAFDGIITECSLEASGLDRFLDRLAEYRPELAGRVRAAVSNTNRCMLGEALIDGRLLPLDGLVSRPTALMSARFAFSVQDMHDIGATQCLGLEGENDALLEAVARRLDRITTPAELAGTQTDLCNAVKHVWFLGELTGPPLDMYTTLRQSCGFSLLDSLRLVAAGEYNGVIEQTLGQPDICANAQQYLVDTSLSVEEQINADVPYALYTCPQLARALQRNHQLIPLSIHLRILQSATPCELAHNALWLVDQQGWFVSCMPNRSTLVFADGTTLTDFSSWQEKITTLGQPYAEIEQACQQPVELPVDPQQAPAVPPDATARVSEEAIATYGFRPPSSIRAGMIHGVYVAGPISTLPANTNLLRNSELAPGGDDWAWWGDLTPQPTGTGLNLISTGEGSFFQDIHFTLTEGTPLEMQVDLGNASAASREVELIVHDVSWSDVLYCRFMLPPNQSVETYMVRGMTAIQWDDIRVEIVPKTYDGQPLQIDSVYLQSGFSSASNAGCIGPAAPPDTDLVRNGDLAAGDAEWLWWGEMTLQAADDMVSLINTGEGSIFQDMGYKLPERAPVEMMVDLGNTSAASKDVELIVHNADWSDVLLCSFTLPSGQPLMTYTLRGQTKLAWDDIRLEIVPKTYDGQPALQVDNVSLQYRPGAFSAESVMCADAALSATKPATATAKTGAAAMNDRSTSLLSTLPASYTREDHYAPRFDPAAEQVMVQTTLPESTDLFLLQGGKSLPLTFFTVENEIYPAFDPYASSVAYLAEFPDGQTTLNLINVNRRTPQTLLESNVEYSVIPAPLAWSPDGIRVLVTLRGAGGLPSIYAVDLSNLPRIEDPELVIANGSAPAYAPNGQYVAFEREVDGVRAVYVATVGTQLVNAITDPTQGMSCFDPAFGQDSISLFFTCDVDGQSRLYQYKVGGVTEITLDAAPVANPAPGPGFGFVAFDDGEAIYFANEDGTDVNIMLRLEGLHLFQLSWPTFLAKG